MGGPVRKSRQTQRPVLAGAISTDFTKKTNKGPTGTEVDSNTLAGTSRCHISRLYSKSINYELVPKSRQTHWPELAGALSADFTTKSIKGGAVLASGQKHWLVLAGAISTDFSAKPIKGRSEEVEETTLAGTSGRRIDRLY